MKYILSVCASVIIVERAFQQRPTAIIVTWCLGWQQISRGWEWAPDAQRGRAELLRDVLNRVCIRRLTVGFMRGAKLK